MRENQLHSILFRIACSVCKYSLATVKRAVSVRMLAAGNKARPKCVKCNKNFRGSRMGFWGLRDTKRYPISFCLSQPVILCIFILV